MLRSSVITMLCWQEVVELTVPKLSTMKQMRYFLLKTSGSFCRENNSTIFIWPGGGCAG